MKSTPPGAGAWAPIACAASLLAVACAHHEPDPDEARERAITPHPTPPRERVHPLHDVGAELTPCPPDFRAMSVREVRAKMWPSKMCFAITGHLSATYAEGPVCRRRPMAEGARTPGTPGTSSSAPPSGELPRCARGWVLTDLSDPIIVREDGGAASPPFIRISSTGPYMPWMDALLACNRDPGGHAIMPPRTRSALPFGLDVDEIPRSNGGLAGVTVGVFGGTQSCCGMADAPDDFGSMTITHFCRVDAPDAR